MNEHHRIPALLITVSLTLTGCMQSSSSVRDASFSPFATTTLGGEPIAEFLFSRTALLVTGDHLIIIQSPSNPEHFTFEGGPQAFSIGFAAAIDRRGYFLTAAHCLSDSEPYLTHGTGANTHVARARVVWRGDLSRGEPDLALLFLPQRMLQVFEWRPEFQPGERIFAVGPNYAQPLAFQRAGLSGLIEKYSEPAKTLQRQITIFHDAPLHRGDSGGPLVGLDERLIAINVKGGLEFSLTHPTGKWEGTSLRPDLTWLRQILDADYAKQAEKRPNQASEPTPPAGADHL